MWFAYIDESGDTGAPGARGRGGSLTYTLGCVLVHSENWPDTFDQLIGMRRFLRDSFGLPVRAEVKASYLLHNRGPFRDMNAGDRIRHDIYRTHMRIAPKLGMRAFGIVVRKDLYAEASGEQPDFGELAWVTMLERLERFSTKSETPLLIVHDEGDNRLVRKQVRKARRHISVGSRFGGSLRLSAKWLLDDPVPRDSSQSYFLQIADLCAYAAFRAVLPPGRRIASLVPATMWTELGDARVVEVNRYSKRAGEPDGIKIRCP